MTLGDAPQPDPVEDPVAAAEPDAASDPPAPEVPAPIPLTEPSGGVPPIVDTPEALAEVIAGIAAASGPVAVDAERASGYRYGQRAYLVQLRRGDGDIALIDPIALPDLSGVAAAVGDEEWVLHAATQDLPCLLGVGMAPKKLFDTELAARIAGFERVGLATMVEVLLGLALAKEHSAADWSRRPLPEPWLRYAALDVEILVELRNLIEAELIKQGKLDWALEEFASIVAAEPPKPRQDPWRRTSGMHRIRNRRQLAVIRALWTTRDQIAQDRDIAPGRILPDSSIVSAALALPTSVEALGKVSGWSGRATKRLVPPMFDALADALALPDDELPQASISSDAPPPPSRWPERNPEAAARLVAVREVMARLAEEHNLPPENLLSPDTVRRLAWSPPNPLTVDAVGEKLSGHGARNWQIGLTATELTQAIQDSSE